MTDGPSFYPDLKRDIAPAAGKLGVLLPGLGAVSTTLIAGVRLIEKGLARPIGSITQMQHIRLGKRTAPKFVPIGELVPLAGLSDLVFGAWDIFPDNAWESALAAGVLPKEMLEKVRPELEAIAPWPAVFDREWVQPAGRAARQVRPDEASSRGSPDARHRRLPARATAWPARHALVRLDGGVRQARTRAREPRRLREGLERNAPEISPSMIYAYAALSSGVPFGNGAPNLSVDFPAMTELARRRAPPSPGRTSRRGRRS